MKWNTKIKFNLILSYFIIFLMILVFFFVTSKQLKTLFQSNENQYESTTSAFLLGNTMNDLLDIETLKQHYLEHPNNITFKQLKNTFTVLKDKICQLQALALRTDYQHDFEIIQALLDSKLNNFIQLKDLYQKQRSNLHLENVTAQLKQLDTLPQHILKDSVSTLKRRGINKIFRSQDKRKGLTKQKIKAQVSQIDSIVEDISTHVSAFVTKDKKIKKYITRKEKKLLKEDLRLNGKLRKLLLNLERATYKDHNIQVKVLQSNLHEALITVGLSSVLTILMSVLFFILIRKNLIKNQQFQKELLLANNKIKDALESREQMMQMVAHDVRTPLQVILGNLEVMNSETSLLQNTKNEMLYASKYILNLVTDLLSFLRGNDIEIVEENFNPKILIEEILQQFYNQEYSHRIQIKFNCNKALDTMYCSDPHRIRQIVNNLITNAFKFTEQGSIQINAKVTFDEANTATPFLKVAISDTGVGIPDSKKEIILKRFQRGAYEKSTVEGFGLGLYITNFLVQKMNGKLDFVSKVDQGSTFSFSIPLGKSVMQSNKKHEFSKFENVEVYIIDDNQQYLDFMQVFLFKIGVVAKGFSNARNALKEMEKKAPNLILSDIQMPKMDGFAFVKALKKKMPFSEIPIVAFTGNTPQKESYYIEAGFSALLLKPADKKTIYELLCRFVKSAPTYHQGKSSVYQQKTPINLYKEGVFDLRESYIMFEGDMQSLMPIVKVFVHQSYTAIEEIYQAMTSNDVSTLCAIAHRVAPLFKQFHMHRSYMKLKELEQFEKRNLNEPLKVQDYDTTILEDIKADIRILEGILMVGL